MCFHTIKLYVLARYFSYILFFFLLVFLLLFFFFHCHVFCKSFLLSGKVSTTEKSATLNTIQNRPTREKKLLFSLRFHCSAVSGIQNWDNIMVYFLFVVALFVQFRVENLTSKSLHICGWPKTFSVIYKSVSFNCYCRTFRLFDAVNAYNTSNEHRVHAEIVFCFGACRLKLWTAINVRGLGIRWRCAIYPDVNIRTKFWSIFGSWTSFHIISTTAFIRWEIVRTLWTCPIDTKNSFSRQTECHLKLCYRKNEKKWCKSHHVSAATSHKLQYESFLFGFGYTHFSHFTCLNKKLHRQKCENAAAHCIFFSHRFYAIATIIFLILHSLAFIFGGTAITKFAN